MKNHALKILFSFIIILIFSVGCSSDSGNSNSSNTDNQSSNNENTEETIVLKAGTAFNPEDVGTKAGHEFVNLVKEKTEGKVEIDFFDSEQLGSGNEQLDNLKTGTQDIFLGSDYFATLEPDYNVLSMPYAFDDIDHFKKFLESDIHDEIKDRMIDNHGIRVIADNLLRSPRVMITTEAIETPEDVKGMNIRTPDIPVFVSHMEQLGATPVTVDWGELYMALQQGLVKGENPTLDSIYAPKLHEVAPYISELNHSFSSNFIVIREESFQKLNDEMQQSIIEAANEAGVFHEKLINDLLVEQKEMLSEEGAIFSTPDRELFKEKVLPMADKLEEEGIWTKGLVEKIQSIK